MKPRSRKPGDKNIIGAKVAASGMCGRKAAEFYIAFALSPRLLPVGGAVASGD